MPPNQYVFLLVCLFLVFRDRVSLYIPGCPGTHFVHQAGLELRNPPASASQVLGLKAFATTPSCYFLSFFFPFFIRYLAHLHFQYYTKSPPYPPTSTPLPTHSSFLALAFPCTGAYKVCKSNGPPFPVMADLAIF